MNRLRKIILTLLLGVPCAALGQAFNLFQPATGVLVGSTTTYVTTAAASTDIVSLWTGTCNATSFLRGDGSCVVGSFLTTPVSATNGGTGEAGTITGIPKANGAGAFTAAVAADVSGLWSGTCNATTFLRGDGSCVAGNAGTVTSVGLAAPNWLTVSNSPVTTSGTLTITGVPAADVNSLGLGINALTQGGYTGFGNTAVGQGGVLGALTSGGTNTAVGFHAGRFLTTGTENTAIGAGAISTQTTAVNNTAVGANSLAANTSGAPNAAFGYNTLKQETTGSQNTALGSYAGQLTTAGDNNTLVGYNAGGIITVASDNTLIGKSAGSLMTTGASNLMLGENGNITTGSSNILIGNLLTGTAATASNQVDIADLLRLNNTSTAVPVISACGTSPTVDSKANSYSGTVTVGTTTTSCTITFASAYASFVHCRVTSQTSIAAFAYSYTTAAITTTGTALGGDKVDYQCDGL
jgi:hypothetical protein